MAAVANSSSGSVAPIAVSVYAWASAVSFGLVAADQGYAEMLRNSVDAAVAAGLFSRMADFLLLTTGITVLAALVALAGAWGLRAARMLLIASLVLGSAGFWVPVVLPAALAGSGAPVRLAIAGGASVLAMLALRRAQRPY